MGTGDYYGTGFRNKIGKIRSASGVPAIGKKKLGTPPKKLA